MKAARSIVAGAFAAALVASAGAAQAAPKKQCITAAETGQQLRSAGRLLSARRALAACTASSCPTVVRRDCGRWIEEIDAAQPSVTVKLEDVSGADVPDGTILLDGEPVPRAADGRATQLDPGAHKLVWVRDAGRNVEQDVVVREGERNRVIVLRASGPELVPRAGTTDARAPEDAPPPPGSRSPVPFVVGGLGVAAVAAGAIFWGIGLNERSNLGTSCAAAHACAQNDVDASRTKLIVGDVLVGVGVLAVAGAVVLYLTQDAPRGASSARAPLAWTF
jgi:hypothetical protein